MLNRLGWMLGVAALTTGCANAPAPVVEAILQPNPNLVS